MRCDGYRMRMARIRATCPDCGDIELPGSAVTVHALHGPWDEQTWSYSFMCPGCRVRSSIPTGRRIADLLLSAGVRLRAWTPPVEARPSGLARLTEDDLIDFHSVLADGSWERQVLGGGRTENL